MSFKILRDDPETKKLELINGEYEIYAKGETTILPDTQNKVKTGIRMEFSEDYFAFINYEDENLQTLAGVVDSDYRGEIIVMLYNFSNEPITIKKNEKCANITFHAIKHKSMKEIL